MAAEYGRKMVISTGMATLDEIKTAVRDIRSTGHEDIVLMHCVSVYPCKPDNMNLSFIKILQKTFDLPVGLSDHTESSIAAITAVGMGVDWIEKHFTYDRKAEGFDHAYAMDPKGLKSYIEDIRLAEKACSTPEMKVGNEEAIVKSRARRSLYASRDITPGEIISEGDILIVRPEGSLMPNDFEKIIGRKISKAVKKYEKFSWDLF
jgi:sialic acid synthase SpsE